MKSVKYEISYSLRCKAHHTIMSKVIVQDWNTVSVKLEAQLFYKVGFQALKKLGN